MLAKPRNLQRMKALLTLSLLLICAALPAADDGLDPRGEKLGEYIHESFRRWQGTPLTGKLYVEATMFPHHVYNSYKPPDLAAAKAAVDAAFAPEAVADHPSADELMNRVMTRVLAVVSPRASWADTRNPPADLKKTIEARVPPSARSVDSLWVVSLPTFPHGDEHGCVNHLEISGIPHDMKGVVLDLRGNTGGYLLSVDCIAGVFLTEGTPLYSVRMRGEDIHGTASVAYGKPSPRPSKLPIVVLVDERTASGGLLLAAALQSRKRARLIGEVSEDDGLVLSGYFISPTTSWDPRATRAIQLFMPAGELVLHNGHRLADGVTPDVAMAATDEAALLATASDLISKKKR